MKTNKRTSRPIRYGPRFEAIEERLGCQSDVLTNVVRDVKYLVNALHEIDEKMIEQRRTFWERLKDAFRF